MLRNRRARCGAARGPCATTAPPSAVVRFLVGKNENVVRSAEVADRPAAGSVPPIECAASASSERPARVGDLAQLVVVGTGGRRSRRAATTLVRSVTSAPRRAGSRLAVSSARRRRRPTVAPSSDGSVAVATNVMGVVTTSSPGPTPSAAYAMCSAAVPDVTLTTPVAAGPPRTRPSSNASTAGPVVSQSPRSTSATAATSSSSTTAGRRAARRSDRRRRPSARSSLAREPLVVAVRAVGEAVRHRLAAVGGGASPRSRWSAARRSGRRSAACGARRPARSSPRAASRPGGCPISCVCAPGAIACGQVGDPHARDPRHVELAAVHQVERVDDEPHGLRQGDPEPGHPLVGDRQRSPASARACGRTGRPSRGCPSRCRSAPRENRVSYARGVVVAGDEELVGGQLGRAVEVDRAGRLVGRERDHLASRRQSMARLDDVLRADRRWSACTRTGCTPPCRPA